MDWICSKDAGERVKAHVVFSGNRPENSSLEPEKEIEYNDKTDRRELGCENKRSLTKIVSRGDIWKLSVLNFGIWYNCHCL